MVPAFWLGVARVDPHGQITDNAWLESLGGVAQNFHARYAAAAADALQRALPTAG